MIIISNPTATANEINTIHSLFEKGLELLHIRKPDFDESDMKKFVSAIEIGYRDRLVLHSQHQLATELGINRIHFTKKNRKEATTTPARFSEPCRCSLKQFKANGFHLSTSVHSIEDFNTLDKNFEYAFLSPVFPSISKENYYSKIDLFETLKNRTNYNTQLVALGGIEFGNSKKTIELGFDQVALLGTIWNSNNPIKNFELCQKIVLSF
jgi:thiamine-phosphate pyrophosphorylase